MGLDVVELVMRLEEEFDIEIPDQDAELLGTVGAMDDYVARKLNLSAEQRPENWRRVRELIAEEADVPPDSISRSTRVVEDLNFD